VVEPAEIDLDGWRLDLQILAQAAKCHPRSSCWPGRHRAGTLPGGPDPTPSGKPCTVEHMFDQPRADLCNAFRSRVAAVEAQAWVSSEDCNAS
jgi:hypothetical protein